MQVEQIKNLHSVRNDLQTRAFTSELPFEFESINRIFGTNLRNEIELISQNRSKSEAIEYLYSISRSEEFRDIYTQFLLWLKEMLGCEFIYQPHPTFRIQWPGRRAGFFHVDSWVGHGISTINIWVPLTELTTTSTVWMASLEDTKALKEKVKKEKLKVSEYEKIIRNRMHPQVIPLGNFLTFNDNILHGSVENDDAHPRISFDFRIAIKPFNIGAKKIGIDYVSDIFNAEEKTLTRARRKKCKTVVFSHGKLSHLSHVTQRAIISDFCKQNNLIPEMEGSEFYTMTHLPQIKEWVNLEQDKHLDHRLPIVIASRDCFEKDSNIVQICAEGGIELYDALENIRLC